MIVSGPGSGVLWRCPKPGNDTKNYSARPAPSTVLWHNSPMIVSELDARHPGPQSALEDTAAPQQPDDNSAAVDDGKDHGDDHGARDRAQATEIGGRDGPDPTRYGDWEKNGRCIDF